MGYGGILKRVVRIAIPVAVSIATGGNPWATALASSATTAATGGSFKESLTAGVTSYIGSSITQTFNQAANAGLTQQLADGTAQVGIAQTGVDAAGNAITETVIKDAATGAVIASGEAATTAMSAASAAGAGGGGLLDTIANNANQAVGGNTIFNPGTASTGFGGQIVKGVKSFNTPFEWLQAGGDKLLGSNLMPNISSAVVGSAPQTLTGALLGGVTTLTLNQALNTGNVQALEDAGYSPYQIQLLQQEARNAQSQGKYDEFLAATPNPGLSDEEFTKIIADGIERRNIEIGGDITQEQFNTGFGNLTGQDILNQETDLRKSSFGSELDKTFTGDAFDPIDDDIIQSIVGERAGGARKTISNFAARGNLNPLGGRSANEFVTQQENDASNRVRQAGQAVLGGTQNTINTLGDEARTTIGGYKLGDELFNPAPFSEQRQEIIDTQQTSLGDDIRGSLGSEPLFDVNKALQSGGRSQGAVSGTGSNASFLDAIAAREGSMSSGSNRRGVGTRGSGAF
tara:strand:- start:1387 stop:2934 length:1548 start_codon:yes stop_codon:yes gene_type:complete